MKFLLKSTDSICCSFIEVRFVPAMIPWRVTRNSRHVCRRSRQVHGDDDDDAITTHEQKCLRSKLVGAEESERNSGERNTNEWQFLKSFVLCVGSNVPSIATVFGSSKVVFSPLASIINRNKNRNTILLRAVSRSAWSPRAGFTEICFLIPVVAHSKSSLKSPSIRIDC